MTATATASPRPGMIRLDDALPLLPRLTDAPGYTDVHAAFDKARRLAVAALAPRTTAALYATDRQCAITAMLATEAGIVACAVRAELAARGLLPDAEAEGREQAAKAAELAAQMKAMATGFVEGGVLAPDEFEGWFADLLAHFPG